MPTVYVDSPFRSVITDEKEKIKREKRDSPEEDVYVPESEALFQLLSDDAQRRIERERERH